MGEVLTVAAGLAQVGVVLASALWGVPTGEVMVRGKATHYAAGRMQEVVENRGVVLAGYAGGVALNRAGDVGRSVWLEWEDGDVSGPFLVVDCARRGADYVERVRRGYVVEVDAGVARARGFAGWGPVGVKVWFVDPRVGPGGRGVV